MSATRTGETPSEPLSRAGEGATSERRQGPLDLLLDRHAGVAAMLGAGATAFTSILVRLSGAAPSTAGFFRCVYALPLLCLLAWMETRRFGPRRWSERRTAFAAGLFLAADTLFWHHSIGAIGAGLATVLANVQVVVLPLVAWLLFRERPSALVLAALPVALLGVLMISGILETSAFGLNPGKGALLGFAAGLAYVGFLLLLRRGNTSTRHRCAVLLDITISTGLVVLLVGLLMGDLDLTPRWPGAGWLIVMGVTTQVFGWLLIGASLPRLSAGQASILLMFQPIGTMLAAYVIFGESPSPVQLGGVALILGTVLVMSLRNRVKTESSTRPAA